MTTQVLAELDQIINLAEARLPANAQSPENQRLQKRMARSLAEYFKSLQDAFPYEQVDRLYNKYVTEQLGSETRDMLDPLLATFSSDLSVRLNGFTTTAYLKGSAEMITWGKTKGGIPIAYEGPPIEQAISYAEKHCAKLVTQMDEFTKQRLAQVVSEGIKQKRGIPGLARDIRSEFRNMRRYRSEMIARTETNDALEQAFMDRAHDMGIEGKEWVTADPCEICEENEAEGVVPIDHIFSSGHERPPAHPNCVCALAPARLIREATEEAMTPKDWKAEYKKGTPHWAKDMEPSEFAMEFVELMKKHEMDSVLEMGCGNGRDSILFANCGFRVTSIDIVPKAIELAKKNADKAEADIDFKVANVEKLPFDDARFDAVFTLSVLHSTDLEKSLPEVARVLKPKGVAFIYIYGDTQFKTGKPKEDTIKWGDYLTTLKDLGFKMLKSYTEQQEEFDEFGEKHRIFVVFLQRGTKGVR